jgi:hypothetical protein
MSAQDNSRLPVKPVSIRRAMSFRMSNRASQDGIYYNMDTLSVAASRYIRLKIDLMIKIKNGNLESRSKVLSLQGIFDILKEK